MLLLRRVVQCWFHAADCLSWMNCCVYNLQNKIYFTGFGRLVQFSLYILYRQWHTDRCHFCYDVHRVVRPTPVMCSTYTVVCWNVRPRWTTSSEEDLWQRCLSLRPRLVMCRPTSLPTSFQSQTDRSSWRQSCSIKASGQQSMSACLSVGSAQQLRWGLWNRFVEQYWCWYVVVVAAADLHQSHLHSSAVLRFRYVSLVLC